jgi:5-methylcytosine-specific restriction endonuclease McrA
MVKNNKYKNRQLKNTFKKKYLRSIFEKLDNGDILICPYCDEKMKMGGNFDNSVTVDHIYPISRGGKINDIDNCLLCCNKCNHLKGVKIIDINDVLKKFESLPFCELIIK